MRFLRIFARHVDNNLVSFIRSHWLTGSSAFYRGNAVTLPITSLWHTDVIRRCLSATLYKVCNPRKRMAISLLQPWYTLYQLSYSIRTFLSHGHAMRTPPPNEYLRHFSIIYSHSDPLRLVLKTLKYVINRRQLKREKCQLMSRKAPWIPGFDR